MDSTLPLPADLHQSLTILDDLNTLNVRLEHTDDLDLLSLLSEASLPASVQPAQRAAAQNSQQETPVDQQSGSRVAPSTAPNNPSVSLQVSSICLELKRVSLSAMVRRHHNWAYFHRGVHKDNMCSQDLESALRQIVDGVVQKLSSLLPDASSPDQVAKLNKLHRFLDKLQEIRSKISSLQPTSQQAGESQARPYCKPSSIASLLEAAMMHLILWGTSCAAIRNRFNLIYRYLMQAVYLHHHHWVAQHPYRFVVLMLSCFRFPCCM